MIFAGLDTGDRCWLVVRDCTRPKKRIIHAAQIALGDVVEKTVATCRRLGVQTLCCDERPAVHEVRTIAAILNGIDTTTAWPSKPNFNAPDFRCSFASGLSWSGKRWATGLRCALVRFSKRSIGDGIEHQAAEYDDHGQTKFVPLIACNRFETINRAVNELLTPQENVVDVVKGAVRTEPLMLFPKLGHPMSDLLERHHIAGSARVREDGEMGDYVDGVENHLLLANSYSALAEIVAGSGVAPFSAASILDANAPRKGW